MVSVSDSYDCIASKHLRYCNYIIIIRFFTQKSIVMPLMDSWYILNVDMAEKRRRIANPDSVGCNPYLPTTFLC